jgi:hypothetical protein
VAECEALDDGVQVGEDALIGADDLEYASDVSWWADECELAGSLTQENVQTRRRDELSRAQIDQGWQPISISVKGNVELRGLARPPVRPERPRRACHRPNRLDTRLGLVCLDLSGARRSFF